MLLFVSFRAVLLVAPFLGESVTMTGRRSSSLQLACDFVSLLKGSAQKYGRRLVVSFPFDTEHGDATFLEWRWSNKWWWSSHFYIDGIMVIVVRFVALVPFYLGLLISSRGTKSMSDSLIQSSPSSSTYYYVPTNRHVVSGIRAPFRVTTTSPT